MAKLTRYTMKLFGSTAGAGEMAEYGAAAAAGFSGAPAGYSGSTITPTIIQTLSNYLAGWSAAVDGTYNPALEDVNAIDYLFSYMLNYLMQEGVAEWDSATTYYTGSLAQDGSGNVYVSLQDTNLNHAVTVVTWWKKLNSTQAITTVTGPTTYTITGTEQVLSVDASAGAVTINLPDLATFVGHSYAIDRIDGTVANAVSVVCAGSDTLAEPVYTTTYPFDQYESHSFFAGSTKWKVRG